MHHTIAIWARVLETVHVKMQLVDCEKSRTGPSKAIIYFLAFFSAM